MARQLNWFPTDTSEDFHVDQLDIQLARQGVEFNRLRQVGKNSKRTISVNEATSFYQLLKATSQIEKKLLARPDFNLETMLQDPAASLARPVSFTGHVRRATEIKIEDELIRNELGIDKYYQLDLFVPLEDRRIVIRSPDKNPDAPDGTDKVDDELVIENRFPITVCTASLPVAVDAINRHRLEICGLFFKNWSYESELTIEKQFGVQQIAPLIIAAEPRLAAVGPDYFGWLLSAFGIIIVAAVVILAWFMRPAQGRSIRTQMPDKIELPNIEP